jgi:hypothetical protein
VGVGKVRNECEYNGWKTLSGGAMKKYLFGFGAMLVGAGLMFVLMHGEVSAEGEDLSKSDFICHERSTAEWEPAHSYINSFSKEKVDVPASYQEINWGGIMECKKGNLTCYISSTPYNGMSCFKEGLFK